MDDFTLVSYTLDNPIFNSTSESFYDISNTLAVNGIEMINSVEIYVWLKRSTSVESVSYSLFA